MPLRLVREDMLRSARVMDLPVEARWLWVACLLTADDFGIFEADAYTLHDRAKVTRAHVPALLQLMGDVDLVRFYPAGGKTYAFIPRFRQRIQVRRLKHPPPPPELLKDEPEIAAKIAELQIRDTPSKRLSDGKPKPDKDLRSSVPQDGTESHGDAPLTRAKRREARGERREGIPNTPDLKVLVVTEDGDDQLDGPEAFELTGDETPPYRVPPCPVERIVAAYHRILPTARPVELLTDRRRVLITTRWRMVCAENKSTAAQAFTWFESYLKHAAQSAFLRGEVVPKSSRKPFRCSIEFLFSPESFARVFEGFYH